MTRRSSSYINKRQQRYTYDNEQPTYIGGQIQEEGTLIGIASRQVKPAILAVTSDCDLAEDGDIGGIESHCEEFVRGIIEKSASAKLIEDN